MTEIKDGKPTPTVYQGGIQLAEVTKAADGLGKYYLTPKDHGHC